MMTAETAGRADPDHARQPRAGRTAPRLPQPGRPAVSRTSARPGASTRRGVSFGAAFGDLDGDGNLDLVYANYQTGVTLLRNDCDTGHRVIIDLRGTRLEPLRRRRDRADRERARACRSASSCWPAATCPAASRSCISAWGTTRCIKRLTVDWPSGQTPDLRQPARSTGGSPSRSRRARRRCCRRTPDRPPPAGQFAEVSQADRPGAALARGGRSTRPRCSGCCRSG